MSATTKEELIEEIISNARRDRKRLEAVADGLTQKFQNIGEVATMGEGDEAVLDPEVAAAFSEEITKVSEALCRVNHELVELVKIDSKKAPALAEPTKLSPEELQSAYEEIHPEEQPN
jgi:ubiquinone biosynthesis protein UbiJ